MGEYDHLRDSLKDIFSDDEIERIIENEKRTKGLFEQAVDRHQSRKQSSAGQNKRGHIGPAKVTLKRIVEGIGSARLEDVLNAIEDETALDICDAMSDPTPWIFTSVDRKDNFVTYTVRKTSQEKTMAVKTLNNHLTAFR